jgi:benzoyl-CoA-dihydrodiol lyase
MKRAQAVAAAPAQLLSGERKGVPLGPLTPDTQGRRRSYRHVELSWDPATRTAQILVRGPSAADLELVQQGPAAIHAAGDQLWALRAFRELDDALLQLRFNHADLGLVLLRTVGDPALVLAHDDALWAAREHWFANEVIRHMARVLRRLDLTSRSFFAMANLDQGQRPCFAGCLLELALAADRFYVLDDAKVQTGLGPLNEGPLPMTHGLSRLGARLYGDPAKLESLIGKRELMDPEEADAAGLVTVRLDGIDWDDDTRVAIEERASLSPDALTGMEANLRFVGHETEDSKIFARLTAWQNWIFIRPNATGPEGALSLYGKPQRPHFDWNRVYSLTSRPSGPDRFTALAPPSNVSRTSDRRTSYMVSTTVDLNAKIPNNVGLSDDVKLQRALESWLPNYLAVVERHGSVRLRRQAGVPAHRRVRRERRLGPLRLRQDARLPLGHLPQPAPGGGVDDPLR